MIRRTVAALAVAVAMALPAMAAAQEPMPEIRIIDVDTSQHPVVSLTVDLPAALSGVDGVAVVERGAVLPAELGEQGGGALEVVLVLDTSGSMVGDAIAAARAAASAFVAQLPAGSRVAVVGFGSHPYLVSELTSDVAAAAAAIGTLGVAGDTALYDALTLGAEQFSGAEVPRSIVLVSDGADTASAASLDAVTAVLTERHIRLFGVQLVTAETNRAAIGHLASATGGRVADAGDPAALASTYQAVAADAVRQVRVSYRSNAAGPTGVAVRVANVTSAPVDVAFPSAPPPAAPPMPAPPSGPAPSNVPLLMGGAALFLAALVVGALSFTRPPQSLLARERRARTPADRRGLDVGQLRARAGALVDRGLERRGRRQALGVRLENAGIMLRPGEYVAAVVATAVIAAVLGAALAGPVLALLLGGAVVVAARTVLNSRTERRRSALEKQLPDMIQQLCGSLQAGYGVMQAVDSVSREIGGPMADELRRLVHEVHLGREFTESLRAMADRIGGQDVAWVVQAMEINREVGGDLAEVLSSVGDTIRAREHLRRQIRTLSAQGRLSARILLAMPFVMAALLSVLSPGYLSPFAERSSGIVVLGVGAVLMLVGWSWLRRIVRLQY